MESPGRTRHAIAPLHVPWLHHEHFTATKVACSTKNGLVISGKNSLVRIVQELKRGRANVDKQLSQLDTQLLCVSDYVDGKRSTLFPPQLILEVDDTVNVTGPVSMAGRRHCGSAGGATAIEKGGDVFKNQVVPPTPAMVEDDLHSDTPCTTTGLWKYLYAYSFFKMITPDDMEQTLLLEDLNAFCETVKSREDEKDELVASLDCQRLQDKFSLSRFPSHDLDDFFMERLLASMCAVDTPASMNEGVAVISSQPDDEDKHLNGTTETITDMETSHRLHSIDVRSWNAKGLTQVLRNIELLEGNDEEIARVGLSDPTDDEVSQEIRSLERQLRTCVRETNETKRKLRRIMAETKPWLSEERMEEKATIEKYFTMWQMKKELARKKKLREKKFQRRQALRLGGGGGSGKPLADDIYIKQR